MKKTIALLLALVMVFALCACGGSSAPAAPAAPAASGDTKTDAPAAPAADDTVYKLKINYYSSEVIGPGVAMAKCCEMATERSGGRLQFDQYYNGTYVSKADTAMSLATGTIDIGLIEISMLGEVGKLNQVFACMLKDAPPTLEQNTEVEREMVATIPELNAELAEGNMRWLSVFSVAGMNLHGNSKMNVQSFDDVSGMKICGLGDVALYINGIGAAGVELAPPDYYSSLERNMIDCMFAHWPMLDGFKLDELCTNHTIFGTEDDNGGLYMGSMGFVINLDTWNKLPADLQQILTECFDEGSMVAVDMDVETIQNTIQLCRDRGDTFYYINGDARKPFVEAMDPLLQTWFAECAAKGYDGEAVYNKMIELQAKYTQG